MRPIASPLNIIDFAVMNFEFKFIPPEDQSEFDIREGFKDYDLDIDFSIHSNEAIQVFMKADINRGKTIKPGYSIFAEVACLFEFDASANVPEGARDAIEGFSTVYIALNSLRGFIQQITTTGPIGRYLLPSVDLNDLINKKKEVLAMNEATEQLKPKSSKSKKK